MALHRLASITIGVPNVADTSTYYREFGLVGDGSGFATSDGGEQLRIVPSPVRRLIEVVIGADDPDDLDLLAHRLGKHEFAFERGATSLDAVDPSTGVRVRVLVEARTVTPARPAVGYNSPGQIVRANERARGILREGPVRPRKLGHVVIGTTDLATSHEFFVSGIGFKVSDRVGDIASFLRCSTDHHNLLLQSSPVPFLHHTSWQLDDVDEVGRGAVRMLEGHPERHVWGLGRHFIGSNFFWYLRDPAGNFAEYYSDMDAIVDDQAWTPGTFEPSLRSLYAWGPDVPPSMLAPDDLADLMAHAHQR